MAARPGAAIDWLLAPWILRERAVVRAGRICALAAALIAVVLPGMILYYGIDDWWWDMTLAVCTMSLAGVLAFDSLAELVATLRGRPLVGLWRVGFLVAGLAVGILAGYLVLLAFTLSPERSVAMVMRDYRRTMGILMPVVAAVVVTGASLWYRAEASRLQGAAATASYAVLKGQMQPHLLFNALNALKQLTLDDPARASEFAQRLADLYRLILEVSTAASSTLAHEAAIVDNYLEVEQVRYGERLRYAIEIPDELRELQVPSLMLQTLAENAVRHGIAKARGGGTIELVARRDGATLVIEMTNTGAPYDPTPSSDRAAPPHGLANSRTRLELMYGAAARLSVGPAPTAGTLATLELPVEGRA